MSKQVKSPFKFLDAYDKGDKDIFFGRTRETYELYDRIQETNLVLLYGASGTGKTSLINCGLSNQFESTDWHPIFIRRRDSILASIREQLQGHAITKLPIEAPLIKCMESLYMDYFKPIYLIFDQFEEIFILGTKEEQKKTFEAIYDLLESDVQCKVLVSMREEYIAHLSEYEDTIPYLFDNRFRVEKMNSKNLKHVIEGTAREFDIELAGDDEQISELIIKLLRGKSGEIDLANLQVYLDRLYRMDLDRMGKKTSRKQVVFDKALIQETGNLEDVMSDFLDEQLTILGRELNEKYKDVDGAVPMNILFELVTDTGTKQAKDIDQIKKRLKQSKNIDANVVDYCIRRFKEMRILRELS